jgi:hypothetical protein
MKLRQEDVPMKSGRKALFFLSLVIFIYLCIEAASFGVYSVKNGTIFSFNKIAKQKEAVGNIAKIKIDSNYAIPGVDGTRVIHPYMGFVYEPEKPLYNLAVQPKKPFESSQCKVNKYGFTGEPVFLKKQENTINIVILGGSVANQLFCLSRNTLIDTLKTFSNLKNKTIHVVGLGIGAYRQPQQLMAINYYLAHGGEFDILINVDGFNEAHFPKAMMEKHIFPSYPFRWNQYIASFNTNQIKEIGKIALYQRIKQRLVAIFDHANFSVTANVLWSFLDGLLDTRIYKAHQHLEKTLEKKDAKSFHISGPNEAVEDIVNFSVDIWFRSSHQLANLAKMNGASYFHFIQPNIHIKNSKALTDNEKSLVKNLSSHFNPDILNTIYPLFSKKGQELIKFDTHFYDLTYIFKNEKQTIYVDTCCHYNQVGNDVMAKFIGQKIIEGGL